MIDRKEIKRRAKEFAFNNKWLIWKPLLISSLIVFAIEFLTGFITELLDISENSIMFLLLSLASTILTIPISFAATAYIMKSLKGEEANLEELIKSRYKYLLPIVIVTLVTGLLVIAGTILFIIPGLIISFRLSQTAYIMAMAEEDEMKNLNPIKESNKLMKGNSWNYFVFGLSFIGWILLCVISLGIALIWVEPYIIVAQIYYYEELKNINNEQTSNKRITV